MPKPDPRSVPYRRWRNLRHRYLVEVLDVHNYRGESGDYRTVTVRRVRGHEERTWSVDSFLRAFQPVGRKIRKKTAWDLLQE